MSCLQQPVCQEIKSQQRFIKPRVQGTARCRSEIFYKHPSVSVRTNLGQEGCRGMYAEE